MYINDLAPDYWSEKYQELPDEIGPAAENKEVSTAWMRMKGLRYGGKDGGGDYWVSRSGKVYHFDDRPAGSDPNDDAASDTGQGSQPGYTPTGNAILTTVPVTATPVTFWPSQNNTGSAADSSYTDIPQTAGIGKYSKQSVKKTALSLPCVQQAINSGSVVTLQNRYMVNGTPITSNTIISKGIPGTFSQPVTVTFTGNLNSDGSQAAGFKACLSASCGDISGATSPSEAVPPGRLSAFDVNLADIEGANNNFTPATYIHAVSDKANIINNSSVLSSFSIRSSSDILLLNKTNSSSNTSNETSSRPDEQPQASKCLFIDIDSGKYLGRLKDYSDDPNEKIISFPDPKIQLNIKGIDKEFFDKVNSSKISKADEAYAIGISRITKPIRISFKKIIKDVRELVKSQIDQTNSLKRENMDVDPLKIKTAIEGCLIIYYSPEKIVDTKDDLENFGSNGIVSCVLPSTDNTSSETNALNIYQIEDQILDANKNPIQGEYRFLYVTLSNYNDARKYWIYRMNRGDRERRKLPTMDMSLGEVDAFRDDVIKKRQFVICDSHTHPCQEKLKMSLNDSGGFITIFQKDEAQHSAHSAADKSNAQITGKPDLVLTMGTDRNEFDPMLVEIAVVRKVGDMLYIPNKSDKSTGEVLLKKFENDIQSIVLNKIIKQYFYGSSQPQ